MAHSDSLRFLPYPWGPCGMNMVPSELVGAFALSRHSNRALGYGGGVTAG